MSNEAERKHTASGAAARVGREVLPHVELQHVTKRFGQVVAVRDLSLTVQVGEFLTLLGPSGCGKTTVLRMIAGLEHPDEGEIWINGQPVFSWERGVFAPPGLRNLGMVFQNFALWPHMTVFENVAFGLHVRRCPPGEISGRVEEALSYLHLQGLGPRYPHELSGGQQQRVALARMLVTRPSLLLMDEPLSNLDAKLRTAMRAEVKRVHVASGATTIYVTHDQVEALTMSDRVAVMRAGQVLQCGPPQELYEHPATLFVADFVGNPMINLLRGVVRRNGSDRGIAIGPLFVPGQAEMADGAEVTVAVRPEDWRLAGDGAPAAVEQVQPTGSDLLLLARLGGDTVLVRAPKDLRITPGQAIRLAVAPHRVNVFDPSTERAVPFHPTGAG
ncbi:MAG: ABC transporter ATP-binding protein [Armatimonadota bacterium]|nr:ABC transporter ATP-binding protein [Armatimonadota bacterium]